MMPPDRLCLLRSFPAENRTAWPVGELVGNVRNKDPQLRNQFEVLGGLLFPAD
jgi:putative SOS response-associated peptidase YedK